MLTWGAHISQHECMSSYIVRKEDREEKTAIPAAVDLACQQW